MEPTKLIAVDLRNLHSRLYVTIQPNTDFEMLGVAAG
jgi:hypothetical protein